MKSEGREKAHTHAHTHTHEVPTFIAAVTIVVAAELARVAATRARAVRIAHNSGAIPPRPRNLGNANTTKIPK